MPPGIRLASAFFTKVVRKPNVRLQPYAGAIDHNPSSNAKTIVGATNYVRAAFDAGLAGDSIAVTQTQPYGCDVKY